MRVLPKWQYCAMLTIEVSVIIPRGLVDQEQIRSVVMDVADSLRPEVVRIRYEVGDDWSGDPSVFFRVVLADNASSEKVLYRNMQRVTQALLDAVKPNDLGLHAYFDFRSKTEQDELNEATWT